MRARAEQGATLEALVAEFGMTMDYVRAVVGDASRREHRIKPTTLRIVARLQNTDDPLALVASDAGLSKQRISGILKQARAAGIVFPRRFTADPDA